MLKIIHFAQNLSLDITIGAVVMTLFIAKVLQVDLTIPMIGGLAIAIWLIYTVDHLLDAKKFQEESVNPRHAFHQRNFKLVSSVALIVFFVGLWNLKFLPERTLYYGFVLVALSGLYLTYSFISKKALNKEVFAAFVYTAGISTAPISLNVYIDGLQAILILQVFLLAYANLMTISLYELEMDIEDHHASVATLKGASRVRQTILLLTSMNFLLFATQFVLMKSYPYEGIILLMNFVIFILIQRQNLLKSINSLGYWPMASSSYPLFI